MYSWNLDVMSGAPVATVWEYLLSIQEHEYMEELGSSLLISWNCRAYPAGSLVQ